MRTKDPVTDVANECSLVHDFRISSYVYRKGTLAQIEQEIHRETLVLLSVLSRVSHKNLISASPTKGQTPDPWGEDTATLRLICDRFPVIVESIMRVTALNMSLNLET